MGAEEAGSTVPRRQLGRYLQELREAARLTRQQAARELERSQPTIWRVENGITPSRVIEVEGMCRLYGASPAMTQALVGLAKETKARGWWQAYGDVVPEWLDLYIGLEAAASQIDWYGAELVPGLFQTEGYARALIELDHPDDAAEEIQRRVQLRMGRQAILQRPVGAPVIRVVLSEQVLRRPVGGRRAMAAQVHRLAEVSRLPGVTMRIIPFNRGHHLGMLSGAFEVLRFPVHGNGHESEPPTVYSDKYTGAIYLDKPAEVARYDQVFASIWEAALDEDLSRGLLRNAMEGLR